MADTPPKRELLQSRTAPLTLCPWTAQLCVFWSAISVGIVLAFACIGGLTARWERQIDDVAWHARSAVLLVFSAAMMELGFLWTSMLSARIADSTLRGNLRRHGAFDSALTLLEYLIKMGTAVYVWKTGGPVHTDIQAWGGPRPVIFARFAQWSVAVPVLVLITNRAFLAEYGHQVTMLRSAPALLQSFVYVWVSWLMEVTPGFWMRWICLIVCLLGALFASIDQLYLARQCWGVSIFNMKFAMLLYQLITFSTYSALFLFGRFGITGPATEQHLYTYLDATVKVLQGAILALIRSWEDLDTIQHWWGEAFAAKRDYDETLRQAHVPIFGVDLDGVMTHLNESMVEICGIPEAEAVGRSLKELLTKESLSKFDEAFARVTAAGEEASGLFEVSLQVVQRSGAEEGDRLAAKDDRKNLLLNLVPRIKHKSGLVGVVALGQDLTALARLEAVEEKKKHLMSMMSHELRSPLHGMIGLLGMLTNSVENDNHKKQLGMVKACACRLLDLVTNIMGLAEAEKREKEGHEQAKMPVNFSEIAAEVVLMTQLAVDKANKPLVHRDVAIVNSIGDMAKLPLVLGDPYKCTQLLYNLMTNACKFTKKGSVTIWAKHNEEAARLDVMVTDTGLGISEEAQERIFKPFEQVQSHSIDARAFQGIGLGLSLVVEIVRQHEGTIHVRSKVGEGSTFVVSMPCQRGEFCPVLKQVPSCADAEAAASPPKIQPRKAPTETPKKLRERPQILSVDDDYVNQELIKTALSCQYDVVIAMDGHAALEILADAQQRGDDLPDIVLLDIQMPGLTGYQVCRKIRESIEARKSRLPITMLSAKAPSAMAAIEGFDSGSTDFLSKPFDPEVLKKKVAVALAMKDESENECCGKLQPTDLACLAKVAVLEAEKKELLERALAAEARNKTLEDQCTKQKKDFEQCKHEKAKHVKELHEAHEQGRQQAQQTAHYQEKFQTQQHELQKAQEQVKQQEALIQKLQAERPRPSSPNKQHGPSPEEARALSGSQMQPRPRGGFQRARTTGGVGDPSASATATQRALCLESMCVDAFNRYEELSAKDAHIIELTGKLARMSAANRLVSRQLATQQSMMTSLQEALLCAVPEHIEQLPPNLNTSG